MENRSIPSLLHLAATRLDSHCNQVLLERLGIGLSQFRILLTLQHHEGRTQQDVAHSLLQTEASISRQVKILIKQGLVESHISQQNRREHRMFLTSKGDRMAERATEILNANLAPKFESMSEKDQNQLSGYLRKLIEEL